MFPLHNTLKAEANEFLIIDARLLRSQLYRAQQGIAHAKGYRLVLGPQFIANPMTLALNNDLGVMVRRLHQLESLVHRISNVNTNVVSYFGKIWESISQKRPKMLGSDQERKPCVKFCFCCK